MAQQKPKNSLFGCFSDPSFITTDENPEKTDNYIKTDLIASRYLGKSLATKVPPKGRLPDVFFEKKYLTLSSKEQNGGKEIEVYENPGKAERRAIAEAKKKNIVDKDFKVASYPKQPTGPGSFVGTFQGKPFEHQPEYKVLAKDAVPDRPKPQPVNIKTNPPKKGTFGYIGTLLEKPKPFDPNQKRDEFDALRKKERQLWEESKKKNIGGIFKVSLKSKVTFDEKAGTGVSSVFDKFEPKEDPKKKSKSKEPKEAAKTLDLKPFKYSSPAKHGEQGFLNKFANSRGENPAPDPYDSAKLKRKEEKEKAPKPLNGVWKPVSGPKKAVISSLLKRFY